MSSVQVHNDRKRLCLYEYLNMENVGEDELEEYLENAKNYNTSQFQFDNIYDQESDQQVVY